MTRQSPTARMLTLAAAATLLLAACSPASSGPTPSSAPSTTSATPTPTPTATCATTTADEALAIALPQVPPAFDHMDAPWSPEYASTDTYDQCAALSWIVLPIEMGTVSSPNQILLFHHGEYVGTATEQAYGFWPDVVRVDDATINVTFRWPLDGESNAEASGTSVATFAWDDASGAVVMSGELPSY